MKNNKINPIGIKGAEVNKRMIELMGIKPIVENKSTSVVELTKIGPDGKAYAIVRENHQYFIKVTTKTSELISEDFKYIGGLQNKTAEAYPSYAKAIKHLNLNFKSLAEAYGKGGDIDAFTNDNLLKEDIVGFSQMQGMGFSGQGNLEGNTQLDEDWGEEPGYSDVPSSSKGGRERWDSDNDDDEDESDDIDEAVDAMLNKKEKVEDDVELTEMEKLVDDMLKEDDEEEEVKEENIYEGKMSISKAIENFDAIIESLNIVKKKV